MEPAGNGLQRVDVDAVTKAAEGISLWIEVGPGKVLSNLVAAFSDVPIIALDAGGPSLRGLLQALGAAFVLGEQVNLAALFAERFTRPFDLNWQPRFFVFPSTKDAPRIALAALEAEAFLVWPRLELRRIAHKLGLDKIGRKLRP